LAENGGEVSKAIQDQMNMLLLMALNVVREGYEMWDVIPFGMDPAVIDAYALDQYPKRYQRIEKARNQSIAEVMNEAIATV